MLRQFLNSKIHRATVTDANLNYVGSITIDEEFLELAGILEWEKVEILNINNGERFQTYAIKGKRGSNIFDDAVFPFSQPPIFILFSISWNPIQTP